MHCSIDEHRLAHAVTAIIVLKEINKDTDLNLDSLASDNNDIFQISKDIVDNAEIPIRESPLKIESLKTICGLGGGYVAFAAVGGAAAPPVLLLVVPLGIIVGCAIGGAGDATHWGVFKWLTGEKPATSPS